MKNKITVEVRIKDPKSLILKEAFGEGDLGNTHFVASHTLPSMSILVKIGDKEYIVSAQEIIKAVIEMHEKLNTKN